MTELIAYPDVETALIQHLTTELVTARGVADLVSGETPAVLPDRLVTVEQTDGVTENLIQRAPTLLFQCWGTDWTDTFDLARTTHALVWALPGQTLAGTFFYRVEDGGGPVRFPDSETRRPRYQFTAVPHVRGEVLA